MSSDGLDRIVIEDRPGSVRGTLSSLARRVPPRLYGSHGGSIESARTDERSRPDSEDEARVLDVEATSDGTVREFDVRTLAEDAGLSEDEPCDALVRAIVRRAETGDVIRFRGGRFRLRDLHVIETALVVEGEDSTLDFGESGGVHFRGSHYNGADPEVTVRTAGPVPKSERVVAAEGTTGFGVNDYVLLETGYAGWSSRHPLRTGSGYQCQIARIDRVDAGRLVLDRVTGTRFEGSDELGVEIHRLEPLIAPVFRNLTTVGGGIPLRMESCIDGRFEGCEVARYGHYGQRVDYCLNAVFDGSVVIDSRGHDDDRAEAIHVAHSTATTIDRPRVRTCRLGIGLSNGCRGVEIGDPVIRDASVDAIGSHDGRPKPIRVSRE